MNALRLAHWTDWKIGSERFFIFKFLRELGNWICMCGPGILEFANRACLSKVHYKIMRESSNSKLKLLRKLKFTAAAKHFAPFCATLITKVFFKCINFSCLVGRSLAPYTWWDGRVSRILQLVLSASPECEMNSGMCESSLKSLVDLFFPSHLFKFLKNEHTINFGQNRKQSFSDHWANTNFTM